MVSTNSTFPPCGPATGASRALFEPNFLSTIPDYGIVRPTESVYGWLLPGVLSPQPGANLSEGRGNGEAGFWEHERPRRRYEIWKDSAGAQDCRRWSPARRIRFGRRREEDRRPAHSIPARERWRLYDRRKA